MQDASRENSHHAYAKFVESAWESSRHCTLRGQMELIKLATPINIEEVEPAANIVKRFCTGNYVFDSFVLINKCNIVLQSLIKFFSFQCLCFRRLRIRYFLRRPHSVWLMILNSMLVTSKGWIIDIEQCHACSSYCVEYVRPNFRPMCLEVIICLLMNPTRSCFELHSWLTCHCDPMLAEHKI